MPTHPPIITIDAFHLAAQVAAWRRGSRDTAGSNDRHPNDAGRSYLQRGHVLCAICRRRMFGKTRQRYTYFTCEPRRAPATNAHLVSFSVQQDALLDGLRQFLSTHLFGHQRHALLLAALDQAATHTQRDRQRTSAQLDDQITDLAARQRRLILSIETFDHPQPDVLDSIQLRLAELCHQQHQAEQARQELARQARDDANPKLLDLLPLGAVELRFPR